MATWIHDGTIWHEQTRWHNIVGSNVDVRKYKEKIPRNVWMFSILLQTYSNLSANYSSDFQVGACLVTGEYSSSSSTCLYLHLTDELHCLSTPPPNSPTRNHIKENAAADTMRGLEVNQSLLFLCLVDSHARKHTHTTCLTHRSVKSAKICSNLCTFLWVHRRITQKRYSL